MTIASSTIAIRRGLYDGLVVGGVLSVVEVLGIAVLKNPYVMTDSESHDSMEKIGIWCLAVVLMLGYVAIGAHGQRRESTRYAGAKAGATAGLIAAVVLTLISVAADNLLFDLVVAHHRAVDTPGGPPITHQALTAAQWGTLTVLAPLATLAGALLGQLGGSLVDRSRDVLT